jgi:hypothetical protein
MYTYGHICTITQFVAEEHVIRTFLELESERREKRKRSARHGDKRKKPAKKGGKQNKPAGRGDKMKKSGGDGDKKKKSGGQGDKKKPPTVSTKPPKKESKERPEEKKPTKPVEREENPDSPKVNASPVKDTGKTTEKKSCLCSGPKPASPPCKETSEKKIDHCGDWVRHAPLAMLACTSCKLQDGESCV